MKWLLMVPTFLLGVVLTTQIAVNKQLGSHLHNDLVPAVANMAIGLIASILVTIAFTRQWPDATALRTAPWYDWVGGGVLGVVYLTGTIVLAPRVGASALIGLVVTGQIVFSVMIDNYGWFGFEPHAANLPRLAGCLLLIAGVALVAAS